MDDAQRREAILLQEQGLNTSAIARKLGLPRSTISNFLVGNTHFKSAKPADFPSTRGPTKADVEQMELAALRSKVKVMEQARPNVVPAYMPLPTSTPEARWKAAEIENAEHIRKALLMAEFSVDLPAEPCAISFISDQHISLGNTVDLARMREDAELIAESDGCYAILGGDATDNHIKHRSAVLAARSQPSDQYDLFEFYLGIFAHRVLVGIAGNHDLWTNEFAGVDVLGMLHKKHRICYAPDEALLNIKVGEQPYRVGMRHQFRFNSQLNQTHTCKQWLRMGEHDWDIGCIGHHHEGACEYFAAHGKERIALRPGSYQITSSYSRQYGFSKNWPTCPTVVLYPDRREMVAFHTLAPALRFLRAERGGK